MSKPQITLTLSLEEADGLLRIGSMARDAIGTRLQPDRRNFPVSPSGVALQKLASAIERQGVAA